MLLDAVYPLDQRSGAQAHVLGFLRFKQRGIVWTLYADEHALESGAAHEVHQFLIFGKIEGGLGEKNQRIAILLLPSDHISQNRFDGLLVADEIVVNHEDDAQAGPHM